MVYLITGKAGAGKTTKARRMADDLRAHGKKVLVLDADEIRKASGNDGFDRLSRLQNLDLLTRLAAAAEAEGYEVIVAAIAPRREWRNRMRAFWDESILIYLRGGDLWPGTKYEIPDKEELS